MTRAGTGAEGGAQDRCAGPAQHLGPFQGEVYGVTLCPQGCWVDDGAAQDACPCPASPIWGDVPLWEGSSLSLPPTMALAFLPLEPALWGLPLRSRPLSSSAPPALGPVVTHHPSALPWWPRPCPSWTLHAGG